MSDWEEMFNDPGSPRAGVAQSPNRKKSQPLSRQSQEEVDDAFFALLRQDDESKFMENRPKPRKMAPRRRPQQSQQSQEEPHRSMYHDIKPKVSTTRPNVIRKKKNPPRPPPPPVNKAQKESDDAFFGMLRSSRDGNSAEKKPDMQVRRSESQ